MCKKWFSVMLVMVMIMILYGTIPTAVSAAETYVTGYYTYKIYENGEAWITKYDGPESSVIVPSILDGHKVTRIGERAFQRCKSIAKVYIPYSIKQIDETPFPECDSLAEIIVDENNTNFDSRNNCHAIIETKTNTLVAGCKTTVIPDTVEAIGLCAFYRCTLLTDIVIPESVKRIESTAFSTCTSLKRIIIPDSVIQIGGFAFYGCTSLGSIEISDNVMDIGDYNTFYGCTSLKSIRIPSGVKKIGNRIFGECTSLTTVEIPDSVVEIGPDAFITCSSLLSVNIPKTVISIGKRAFGYETSMLNMAGSPIADFTIAGYAGTEAERYANENGFTFIALDDTPQPKSGDADGDGDITLMDVTEIQHYLSSMKTNADEETMMFADVDKNGLLEIIDATYIQRYLAEIEIPYEIGI